MQNETCAAARALIPERRVDVCCVTGSTRTSSSNRFVDEKAPKMLPKESSTSPPSWYPDKVGSP
eukprot:1096260-Amphidinium_carterae.1